jgi:Flp pilus assembly protein protease CpaA
MNSLAGLHLAVPLLLSAWAVLIGVSDLLHRRIPNVLSLGILPVAAAPLMVSGHAWLGAESSSVATAIGLASLAGFPAYALGKLGAGDVKLMLAIALLAGTGPFVLSYLVAGLLALVLLGWRHVRTTSILDPAWEPARQLIDRLFLGPGERWHQLRLPFGALLCMGFILALWTDI